jgi:FAD/FMN-containing dehydrogenase
MHSVTPGALDTLRRSVHGPVIVPGDADYERARRVWNGDIDRRPAVVVCCLDEGDVSAAVRFAVAEGLEVAVRGGGHSFPGLSVVDDGLVVDLSQMRAVRSTAANGYVAQGGCLLGDLDRAAAVDGRAIPAGVVSHTGVAGLTLGGGYGYLSRRWGLTCDNLRSVRLVDAAGEARVVTDEQDPELMWGLRGGGGNWGVVTELEFDSQPLGGVLAGWILHPFERAHEFVAHYQAFAASMPRELCVLLRLKVQGQTPFLAPGLRGADKTYIGVLVVWSGSHEEGIEALRPLREWGMPVHDDVRPQRYADLQASLDGGARHGVGRYERAGYLSAIAPPMLDAVLPRLADPPSVECEVSVFSLGGAIADVADDATAYSSRRAAHAFEVRSGWTDPAERETLVDWTRDTWLAIRPHAMDGVYVNLVMDEGGDRVRALYGPETYERLARLKARIDPDNVFHLNQNVVPARSASSVP